jgi:hypothetical protein
MPAMEVAAQTYPGCVEILGVEGAIAEMRSTQ